MSETPLHSESKNEAEAKIQGLGSTRLESAVEALIFATEEPITNTTHLYSYRYKNTRYG